MAQAKKAKAAPRKTKAKAPSKALVPAAKPKTRRKPEGGLDGLVGLLDHPLVAELLAVGAMAAVAAIADHSVKTRTGEIEKGSRRAVKAAGKAAASAMGRRLMSEVDAIKKASETKGSKRESR